MASQFFASDFKQKVSTQAVTDTSLPTFGGVTSVTPNNDGSFSVAWSFGSSTKNPLRYEVYIALGVVSASTLFSTDSNVVSIEPDHVNSTKVFTLADDSTYMVKGQVYTFGVKALDAFGYEGGPNTVITSTAISSGNLPQIFQDLADEFLNDHDQFQIQIDQLEAVSTALSSAIISDMTVVFEDSNFDVLIEDNEVVITIDEC